MIPNSFYNANGSVSDIIDELEITLSEIKAKEARVAIPSGEKELDEPLFREYKGLLEKAEALLKELKFKNDNIFFKTLNGSVNRFEEMYNSVYKL